MKNKIQGFLKLRKQSDTVKLICVLALAGILSLANTIYHAWGIYHYVNTPAEYVLTGTEVVLKERVEELLQSGSVAIVSRQQDVPVMIMDRGTGAEVNCTILSQEYVEEMFGVKLSGTSRRIYMNETAFSDLKEALSEESENVSHLEQSGQGNGGVEFEIRYSMPELADGQEGDSGDMTAAPQYKKAKLVVVNMGEKEDKSIVCTAETDGKFLKQATTLRVQFQKHDLDGLQVSNLRKLGYEIENEEVVIAEEYEIKTQLFHIQYGMIVCAICLVSVFALSRGVRKK